MIGRGDIDAARQRLVGVIRPTPVERSDNLTEVVGRAVLLKPEYRQRTGSFKIRGAYNMIRQLPPEVSQVVAASAGNHAQGVALAARLEGKHASIYMPESTPLPKVDATRGYGAEVHLVGGVVDESITAARAAAAASGAVFVPPFDHPHVIAGQATIGAEIAAEAPDAEVVVVPVGGGGLISGIAAALAHARPSVRVIGVEAEGAASMVASLKAGAVVAIENPTTMADGIAVKSPSELTLSHVRAYVDDVVTVTEEEISRALLLLLERAKAVVEPAAAAAFAAVLAGKAPGTGPVVSVLSGGNVDPLLLIKLIDHGMSAAGRYLLLRILLPDRPGTLAALTAAVADLGLNVLSVEHHRSGLDLPVHLVEVRLTLETRDPGHRAEIVEALRVRGYDVTLL